jgi:hypothetical protein
MRLTTTIVISVLALAVASSASAAGQPEDASRLVQTYCAGCHNGVMRSPSNALLDRFDIRTIADNPDVWARAYRQLQAGTMPPFGAPRPDRNAVGTLLTLIEAGLGAAVPAPARANSQDIARRLATLLWNGPPDDQLLREARSNQLVQPDVLEKEVRRMLGDERAESIVSRFFFPWLGLDQLKKAEPDPKFYPGYDAALRDDMATETSLFIRSQLRDDRDPVSLWDADYTFLNERLARHYGIPGVTGPEFRRVVLPTQARGGLLGQGSVLMVTSRHAPGNDVPFTSPAARATWVRMRFLGAPVPRPFPGALPAKPGQPITPQMRALPAEPCVRCHQNFFPLGYALEHFDPIGGWRTDDQGGPVDASGALVDGTPFNGAAELRAALMPYAEAFRTTITERLLLDVAGTPVNKWRPTPETLVRARQVLQRAEPSARWSSVIAAIVRLNPQVDGIMPAVEQTALVKRYCAVCHTDAAGNGGLSLEHYAAKPDPPLAAMLLSKLNTGAMGASGRAVPEQNVQQAWIQSTRAQAAGADAWFVSRDRGVVSASIVRDVPSRDPQFSERPVYRVRVTCDPATRVGEMRLTWSPQPQTGRTMTAAVDQRAPIEYPIEGKESMGNGGTAQTGHASAVLSTGKGGKLAVPSRSLVVRELFPGEAIEFPFSDLDRGVRSELGRCF